MHVRSAALAAVSLACLACWPGLGGAARAQTGLSIPQSERVEHEGTLAYLHEIAGRPTPVGAAAAKVLDIVGPQMAEAERTILPPLVLLPQIASDDPTADMRWAIALADQVRADHDALARGHAELKAALIALRDAATAAGDRSTVGFSNDLLADNLGNEEIQEPTTILIGRFLRESLPAK